jgi:peptide deformylase
MSNEQKNFKEILENIDLEDLRSESKIKENIISVITGKENINIPSEKATIDEAEEIWSKLDKTLDTKLGFGLAAIQIGINKRVGLVKYNNKTYKLLNTRIIKKDNPIVIYDEGCLSLPGKTINTERYSKVEIEDDILGNLTLDMSSDGLLPIVFQHEVDHFNGKTIFDRQLKPIRKGKKIGRNELCPCGSGKKYKKCCLTNNF